MKKRVLYLIKNPLITGSVFLFFGSLGASFLNYLFNLILIRTLVVGDYGTFSSLVSLFNIFSVFAIATMMIFSKLTASLIGQKKEKRIGSLLITGNVWVGIISAFICGLLIIFSPGIANFLNIKVPILIVITAFALFFSFTSSVPQGILQGFLKFAYSSFINIASSLVKLVLGIIFIFLGYKVLGSIMAFFISIFSSYVFAFIPLTKFLKEKSTEENFTLSSLHKQVYAYAIPVFLSNIGIISLISVDIILAKHYFSPIIAGQYAALSLMGRSIFYVVSPISSVLFPIIAQKKERKERLIGTLILSILLVGLPAIFLSAFYFLFPQIILLVLSPGATYSSLAPLLGPFSIFILLYSICFLLNSFYLSIGKSKVFLFTIGGTILECILIILFHANLSQIINDLILSSFLLLVSLLLYYRNVSKDINS